MRLDYRKTTLIGFGFFATSLAWSLYNSLVPLMLRSYIESTTIIGAIMTIDNFFGVVFQPLVGQLSDRTHTRFGRRMPYIMIGIPVCAVLFSLIPLTNTLILMMAVIIMFNLVMSTWRSPVVALMPDMTPGPLRSKANGIINLMGGVGSIIALLGGGFLVNQTGSYELPFALVSVIMVAAVVILFLFVREGDNRLHKVSDAEQTGSSPVKAARNNAADQKTLIEKLKDWLKSTRKRVAGWIKSPEKRSLIFLLTAIFFWFCGFNAVEAFFTLFATIKLGVSEGDAIMSLSILALALIAFAVPAGVLAGHIGRKKMILIGLVGLIAAFIPMIFLTNLWLMRGLMVIGGICWACININSLPMVVELAHSDRIGSYTGYYYFFSFSAAIVSPILFGLVRDLTQDYSSLFIYSVIAFILALACMIMVRHGEAALQDKAGEPEPVEA